jgi:glycine cleavage system H protein
MSKIPEDLKYTASHEWVRLENGVATIGITDHAQEELGDVVYVDMPEPGRVLQAGEAMGSVESVKAVSDIYAPVSGEVIEVNPALAARSELLNTDPYGAGYLVKVKVTGDPTDELLDAEGYSASIK